MDSSHEISYETDAEIDEIILRLDLTLLRPDGDDVTDTDGQTSPGVGGTAATSGSGSSDKRTTPNGKYTRNNSNGNGNGEKAKGGGGGGALDFIRKLKPGSTSENNKNDKNDSKRSSPLDLIKVENLPQKFVTKYIGCKACRGLWGIKHTREPVDGLVNDLSQLPRGEDLPLVRVEVSTAGINVTIHPRTRSRRLPADLGLLPLQFVSYAVQDTRYTRIFAFILVREMSSRARATECHAFLCDSGSTARKMALSVALAFRVYERQLQGKPFKFAVDLRPAGELRQELNGKPAAAASGYGAAESGQVATEGPDVDV